MEGYIVKISEQISINISLCSDSRATMKISSRQTEHVTKDLEALRKVLETLVSRAAIDVLFYERPLNTCLGELVILKEKIFTLRRGKTSNLSKAMTLVPSQENKFASPSEYSLKKPTSTIPIHASPAPLEGEVRDILSNIKKQIVSFEIYRDVLKLIEDGANVSDFEETFNSALENASSEGHEEVVRFLIALGSNLDEYKWDLGSALEAASFKGHQAIVQLLIDYGADVNNALYVASSAGYEDIVRILLENGANPEIERDQFEEDHYNALEAASSKGHTKIVQLLIDYGADVNCGNALEEAIHSDKYDIVQLLLEKGANVNAQGYSWEPALQAATYKNSKRMVQLLLEKGVDVNAQGGYYGNALQKAIALDAHDIVQLLLENGADVNAQGGYYGNALQAASFKNQKKIVQLLLEKGADVNAWGGFYGNALQAASCSNQGKIVQLLLEKGADVNARGGHYGNALQAASYKNQKKVVQLLLEKGADVNAWGGFYGNALQAASYGGHQEIVLLLLEYGADIDAQGKFGTALQAASLYGRNEIVQLLTEARVNIYAHKWKYGTLAEQFALFLVENRFFRSLLTEALRGQIGINATMKHLEQFIERYGEDLLNLTDELPLLRAARRLISHRSRIVRAIFSLYNSVECNDTANFDLLMRNNTADLDFPMSNYMTDKERERISHFKGAVEGQQEAAALLHDPVLTETGLPLTISSLDEQQSLIDTAQREINSNLEYKKSELSRNELDVFKQFLASNSAALNSFLNSACRLVYPDPLEAVKAELLRDIGNHLGPCKVQFELSWRIEEYLKKEIFQTKIGEMDRRIVGSLLTLSGNAHKCYANSCEAYMKWRWPHTYTVLLEAMVLGSKGRTHDTPMTPGSVRFSSDAERTRGDMITAYGTKEFLTDVAQQVSWLTASIRLPFYGQVSLSDSLLIKADVERDCAIYKVFSLPLEKVPLHEKENACWLPLFLGTVIARGYPIPEREQEKGLELPYDLMTTIAGNMVPQCHDGGIFLKGHSRLLYPVSGSIPGSVQWHLLTSLSRRESLPDDLICTQSWLRILDRRLLSNVPRTFLGYCRDVIIDLGTYKTVEHYAGIAFSRAEDVRQGPQIQAPTSLTWGTSGMGIFGATFTHSIIYGKALAQTVVGDNDDYLDVLDTASRTPIILYDDSHESQRGWMVPALCVIFHMIHTWAADKNCFRDGLPCISATFRADDAPRNVLEQNWNFIVRDSRDEEMSKRVTIKDLVMQFWHGIQKRNEDDLFARHRTEPGFEMTSSKLYGWDYMDLVRGSSSRKKQLNFNENWMDLTEDVMVLFGGGFGDVIKPAPGVSICAEWDPIPSLKMYLTATIDCLQKLSRKRGGHSHHLTSSRLTNKSYWNYRTSDLFTDCNDCYSSTSAKRVNCPKVPQRLDLSVHKSNRELLAPIEGAIVFGSQPKKRKSRRSLRHILSKITNKNGSHISALDMITTVGPGSDATTRDLQNGYIGQENVPEDEFSSYKSGASRRPEPV